MEPILQTIAREYSKRYKDLKSICFLFPNKRCGVFLKKYFFLEGRKGEDMPHILTISEFTSQIARKTEASRIEQLLILYNSYLEIIKINNQEIIDFDAFRGWGETVLSDFNIVDQYLPDPEEIFKNIKDYREITSNFLTKEQKEVMKEYFGIEETHDSTSFWKHFADTEKLSPLKQRFINLWQVLAPLHKKFVTSLSSKGLGSSGSIIREAVNKLREKGKERLPYNKIVVIGFNALTGAEREIFSILQTIDCDPGYDSYVDFVWDATGPILKSKDFSASRFVDFNKKYFPSPKWLVPALQNHAVDSFPEIKIISAPTLTAQAKVVGDLLKEYESEEGKKIIADSNVALVLPDESLLSNIIYSLPENIGDINLTMGYNLRHTSVASFMTLLRRVYSNLREVRGENIFYSKDLQSLFSHPYSLILSGSEEIESVLEFINTYHKVSLKLSEVVSPLENLKEILKFPSKKIKNEEIFLFLDNIFTKLIEKLTEKNSEADLLDIDQIKVYSEYMSALKELLMQYEIEISPLSAFQIAERLVSNEKIGFEGEPLSGLQIMGTLETRSLDFRHIIIPSMNEGIMPRKAFVTTFIPETLRKAYGLPPSRYNEEIFSYYFYRLISRAEKVTLIYDGRAISGLRGGVSRYLLQLRQYVPKDKINEETWQFPLNTRPVEKISISKTPEIFDLIENFSGKDLHRKNLSASSLNTYRECEVKFFLQNILNINSDPQQFEYIDSITIGNILHNVMMEIYVPDHPKQLLEIPLTISKEFIEEKLAHPETIRELILKNINSLYYGNKFNIQKEIESGVTEIIAEQIKDLIISILQYDLNLAPFRLYGCEISQNLQVKLSSGRIVNFRFAIDRLDEIEIEGERRLRIVDYKTGARKRFAKSLEEVFEGGYVSEQIFQLFTYAWLLGKIGIQGWEEVVTEIYFVPDLISGKGGLPEINNKKVSSFKPYKDEFEERINTLIESIFTSSEFMETKESQTCSYCPFKSFCGK